MKPSIDFLIVLILVLLISSCSENNNNPANPENLNLDSQLFGKWVFVDDNDDVHGWTFNSDGTCIQTLYNEDFNWNWSIENERLKLFISGGNPAYYTYKIENNKLYLWVDAINDWGLPYTKQ